MHICSRAYPTKHTNDLHLSQMRCIAERCYHRAAKLHSGPQQEKKPLFFTRSGDLYLYSLKALLLKFLIFRNGAMGMENLQLGQNMRAICLSARAMADPITEGSFLPTAQVSAQPPMGTRIGTVSANTTPIKPWKSWINIKRFSSCPVIFSCAGKHARVRIHWKNL